MFLFDVFVGVREVYFLWCAGGRMPEEQKQNGERNFPADCTSPKDENFLTRAAPTLMKNLQRCSSCRLKKRHSYVSNGVQLLTGVSRIPKNYEAPQSDNATAFVRA